MTTMDAATLPPRSPERPEPRRYRVDCGDCSVSRHTLYGTPYEVAQVLVDHRRRTGHRPVATPLRARS